KTRLTSVTEAAPTGPSLPPITFTYQDQINGSLQYEFDAPTNWGPWLNDTGDTSGGWSDPVGQESGPWTDSYATGIYQGSYIFADLVDIDGDGFPDRISRRHNPPYTPFNVQYNNGHGFEPALKQVPFWSPNPSNKMWSSVNGRGYDV